MPIGTESPKRVLFDLHPESNSSLAVSIGMNFSKPLVGDDELDPGDPTPPSRPICVAV